MSASSALRERDVEHRVDPCITLPSSVCMVLSQKCMGDDESIDDIPYLDRHKLDVVIMISSKIPSDSHDMSNESISCDL